VSHDPGTKYALERGWNMTEHVWRAAPSLAMIKYWGKAVPAARGAEDSVLESNIPASFSLAVGLEGLHSETRVRLSTDGADRVMLAGREMDPGRYAGFFEGLRRILGVTDHWECRSENNFPTAAGLASSSSGFAALAAACSAASLCDRPEGVHHEQLSEAARIGSASAARAIWPGFVALQAGARRAEQVHGPDWWPELRVIIVRISDLPKEASSRDAMDATRETSPYYRAWLEDSPRIHARALEALEERDLGRLGPLIRASTMRMFGSMLGADPPVLYWLPQSVAVLQTVARLRREGAQVWETMDAGPQVKLFCLEQEVAGISAALLGALPELEERLLVVRVGGGLTRVG